MIRAAVIDDDPGFCRELRERITELYDNIEIDCFLDIDYFSDHASEYNIAVIDILLKEGSGIEHAKRIAESCPALEIIFVSIERDFFQEVYSVRHSYFLTKPVTDDMLRAALDVCLKNLGSRMLAIKRRGGTLYINLNRVAYFEGILKKTAVHYIDGAEERVGMPLKAVEEMLDSKHFIRTHQSYIVNIRKITYIRTSELMIGDTRIPISRRHRSSVSEAVDMQLMRALV